MMKRKLTLLLSLVLLCGVMMAACSGNGGEAAVQETSAEITYKVTVADALGTPYTSGVIVRFLQNGEQAAMQTVDDQGTAEKQLPRGDYAVELMFTGDESAYHYEKEGLTVTQAQPELTVTLAHTAMEQAGTVYADGKDCPIFVVNPGSNYVHLTPGSRSYFLFTPTVAGIYEFSVEESGTAIGYYGAPHFVHEENAVEVVDNTFSITVRADSISTGGGGTASLVVGIDADENTDGCVLNLARTGDPEWTMEDEPWIVYQPTVELKSYTLGAGSLVREFDLTASADTYKLVLGDDAYYHLDSADGPLVLVHLTKDPKYLPCFKNILDASGVNRYFFDENGDFVKKETYDQCLIAYFDYADEDSGLYPLTEDLKYIIQQRGEFSGWWDADGYNYLFVNDDGTPVPGINPEVAWLFMCCYIAN